MNKNGLRTLATAAAALLLVASGQVIASEECESLGLDDSTLVKTHDGTYLGLYGMFPDHGSSVMCQKVADSAYFIPTPETDGPLHRSIVWRKVDDAGGVVRIRDAQGWWRVCERHLQPDATFSAKCPSKCEISKCSSGPAASPGQIIHWEGNDMMVWNSFEQHAYKIEGLHGEDPSLAHGSLSLDKTEGLIKGAGKPAADALKDSRKWTVEITFTPVAGTEEETSHVARILTLGTAENRIILGQKCNKLRLAMMTNGKYGEVQEDHFHVELQVHKKCQLVLSVDASSSNGDVFLSTIVDSNPAVNTKVEDPSLIEVLCKIAGKPDTELSLGDAVGERTKWKGSISRLSIWDRAMFTHEMKWLTSLSP